MGPMTAAARFARMLTELALPDRVQRVDVKLYASLALTGRGHHTDRAVVLRLMGQDPGTLNPDAGDAELLALAENGVLALDGRHTIRFDADRDIHWAGSERLPQRPNAVTLSAYGVDGQHVLQRTSFSIGGGFVCDEVEISQNAPDEIGEIPYPFDSGETLLAWAAQHGLTIAQLMFRNELARSIPEEVEAGLDRIHGAMHACIERGMGQHEE
jgi:L-serine dehydratase